MSAQVEAASQVLRGALEDAVHRGQVKVPPYPSTALQIQAVLARPAANANDLAEAMRTDQAFTGSLLRLANSAAYRRAGPTTSIAQAVSRVGAKELTRLAMAAALSHAAAGGPLFVLRRRVWRESLASALVSEALAPFAGVDPGEAFVAGLLHDIGKLVALSAMEDLLGHSSGLQVDDAICWREAERAHVSLGALVAQRWQLPGTLGAVIAAHHDERERGAPLAVTVLRADAIVALLEANRDVSATMLGELGLTAEQARTIEALLPRVPGFLNALDTEGGTAEAPPLDEPEVVPHRGDLLTLELSGGAKVEPWPVRAINARRVEVVSPRVLQAGLLVECTLRPAALRFWAVVEACEALEAGFSVTVRAFALGGDVARRWDAVVATRSSL